jgi:hypothetical protein
MKGTAVKRRFLLVAIIVLAFGMVAFAYFVPGHGTGHAQASSAAAISSTPRGSKVVAYYFHGKTRCYTCRQIESLSHDVVTSDFSPQLKTDQLEWQSVNVEQPGNEHFFDDYKLVSWSLVLVTYKQGKQTDYKNLTDVWTLVNNEQAFRSYVKNALHDAIARVQ